MRVSQLIEVLSGLPPDMPVFIYVGEDEDPLQPVWSEGDWVVGHVDYDLPHVGGFYGTALVLGTDEWPTPGDTQ